MYLIIGYVFALAGGAFGYLFARNDYKLRQLRWENHPSKYWRPGQRRLGPDRGPEPRMEWFWPILGVILPAFLVFLVSLNLFYLAVIPGIAVAFMYFIEPDI